MIIVDTVAWSHQMCAPHTGWYMCSHNGRGGKCMYSCTRVLDGSYRESWPWLPGDLTVYIEIVCQRPHYPHSNSADSSQAAACLNSLKMSLINSTGSRPNQGSVEYYKVRSTSRYKNTLVPSSMNYVLCALQRYINRKHSGAKCIYLFNYLSTSHILLEQTSI